MLVSFVLFAVVVYVVALLTIAISINVDNLLDSAIIATIVTVLQVCLWRVMCYVDCVLHLRF